MTSQRLRFSVRSLLVCVAAVAVPLAAGVRFGPHLVWLVHSCELPSVDSIPTTPLVVEPPIEEFVRCEIGALAIDLPKSMLENVDVQRDSRAGSVNLRFTDSTRTVLLNLTPMKNFDMFSLARFPRKTSQTHSQLFRQIAAVKSSDFSFWMSVDELRWHKWLIKNRKYLPAYQSIEHIDNANVETNLLRFSSPKGIAYNLEWASTDGVWKGAVTFHDQADDADWIRFAASTFDMTGDPSALQNATDGTLMALVAPAKSGTDGSR